MRFVLAPEMTTELFEELLDCWTEVTNAGGAVGFVPPVTPDDIRPTAEKAFGRTSDDVLVGFDEEDRAACWLILSDNGSGLRAHWRWVVRVMVHPKHQGKGYGRALMLAADDAAKRLGLEALQLTCRGGTGVDGFYASVGYHEVGRIPRSIRLAPGEERDEIHLIKWL